MLLTRLQYVKSRAEPEDMIALARAFLDDRRWGWRSGDPLGARTHFPPRHMARSEG